MRGLRRASTWPAITLLFTLASCGGSYAGSTVGQQVASWESGSPDPKFQSAVSTLQGDLSRIEHTESAGGSSSGALLRTYCDVLITDALMANQNLPTPDDDLTDTLSSAYSSAVSAGQDCFCAAGGRPCRAGSTEPSAVLERWARETSAAEHSLIRAQARVDFLTTLPVGR